MEKIKYGSNPHWVLMVIASAKGEPKTEKEIIYISWNRKPHEIRRGMDALERRGLIEEGVKEARRNGYTCLVPSYAPTEEGWAMLKELAKETPHQSYRNSYRGDHVI